MISLSEKKCLILGGMGLIGYEISKKLLEVGAEIKIIDIKFDKIKKKKLTDKFGEKKVKFLTIKNFSEKKINKLSKDFSILINCIYQKDINWNKLDIEKITKKNLINSSTKIIINSLWYPLVFANSLKRNKLKGNIINLGSIYGLVGQDNNIYKNTKLKENIVYNYNKSGLVNFTKAMASKFTSCGIRTNLVCPGGVRDKKNKLQNNSFLKNYSERCPIGRLATPDEIANVLLFLASDGSSYMSGSIIVVDGGWLSI